MDFPPENYLDRLVAQGAGGSANDPQC